MNGASRTRLRPDAQVLVDYPDHVKVVLPTGAALDFSVDGSAVEAAVALRTGDKGWKVVPEIMRRLEERGLLVAMGVGEDELFLTGGRAVSLPRRDGRVCVLGDGAVAQAAWMTLRALGAPRARVVSGTHLAHVAPRSDLLLVALDRFEPTTLTGVNAWAVATGMPWLPAGPFEARRLNVGPLMVPDETACWACFVARRRTNASDRQVFDALWQQDGKRGRTPALPAPLLAAAGHVAALEAARFQRGVAPSVLEASWSLGLDGLDAVHDMVLRAPRCAVCSRLRRRPARAPFASLPRGA